MRGNQQRDAPRARRDMRGNVSVLVIAVMVVAFLLCTAVARLGFGIAEKSRANNAADAAALTAADVLASGAPPADACAAARHTAVDNGARLLTCRCRASSADTASTGSAAAEVTVAIGDARAWARAQVDAPVIAGYRAGAAPGESK
jgi:secretion/DNA translocation related TadE-like protein